MLTWTSPALAAEYRKTLQIIACIKPKASLNLNPSHITFDGAEDQATIPALEGQVQLTAKGTTSASQAMTLTLRVDSDLQGSTGTIPVNQVQWTAQGARACLLAGTSRDRLHGLFQEPDYNTINDIARQHGLPGDFPVSEAAAGHSLPIHPYLNED